ncbi:Magnesium and cobalt efflux protein CorC [Candidatus Hoaglandella endobia]|uniref:Magnesium and cobalt efflux protein CorC n=1 Tax=Candidatus Hoaglandella endobia TaxID=1778263 RepID=A0A143WU61_9ENTR|nr:Magnesium and cobalt efflux protein CorC [Candidatus Hoaglandella endobia]
MELLLNPSMWLGLLILIVLEIVLGIDNLVFIAILADKLPPRKRDRTQVIGLALALIMRLGLLSLISWLITLTRQLFSFSTFSFSGRDIILILGGTFLLFKATTELHERLENKEQDSNSGRGHSGFWAVVVQIVILDAVLSLDAIITAVGIVNNLPVMMMAVIIAMSIMLFASRALTRFVKRNQPVVVLFLSFLLMIGFSLIAEGFGFQLPKGYLYAAIGFSIIIELFNQIARRNFIKNQSTKLMRERTAETIIKLISSNTQGNTCNDAISEKFKQEQVTEAYNMITGVLSLASRTLRSIMTSRNEINWLDAQSPIEELREILIEKPHNMFPVCDGELDQLIGIVRAKDLLIKLTNGEQVKAYAAANPAIVVPEAMDVLKLLEELHRAKGSMVIVTNKLGVIQGLITPPDVLEAITSEFIDQDE